VISFVVFVFVFQFVFVFVFVIVFEFPCSVSVPVSLSLSLYVTLCSSVSWPPFLLGRVMDVLHNSRITIACTYVCVHVNV